MESTERHHPPLVVGAALGALTSLAVIGLLYLGEQLFGLPFVPFDIFDWMTRTLPGGLIAMVTGTMTALISFLQGFLPVGDTSTVAKTAEQSIAILQLIGGGAAFGLILAWLHRDSGRNLRTMGLIGGLVLLAVTLLIQSSIDTATVNSASAIWLAALFLLWGWSLAWFVEQAGPALAEAPEADLNRRQFLVASGAGISAVALGAWGLGKIFGEGGDLPTAESNGATPVDSDDPFGASLTSGPAASPSPEELAARPEPVNGTRAELTSTEDYYRIDINTRAPSVDGDSWSVEISGLVDDPQSLNLEDIRAFPAQTQILTMQCISNRIGGDLTSSTRWTGARFKDVVEAVGVQSSAAGAYIESTDGFYEFVTMEDIMDDRTLLVYDMNGAPLPEEHGFPLRVYIPNRYGMKQPKWIETIELVSERVDGYWVERGWSREARPQAVSVVDTVVVDPDAGENGMAMTGGIAWAGDRGISMVEVQVDEGDWQEAELIAPPLSSLTWMLWRYEWPHESGSHTVRVRAYEGDGTLQTTEAQGVRPNGATGIHSVTVNL